MNSQKSIYCKEANNMNIKYIHPSDQLVMFMQRIYDKGLTTTSGGNLSILDDDGNIWITPAGVDKGTLTRGDIVCVKPDGTVTRSDFLIMAMDAAGIAAKKGESGFSDESEFSPYEKKYIATAKSLGITVGIETEDGLCFCADQAISAEEASLIACRISALKGLSLVPASVAVAVMDDDSYNALSILASAGIMKNAKADESICRADAAEILYSIFKYTEKE